MNLQYQNSAGRWQDCPDSQAYLLAAEAFVSRFPGVLRGAASVTEALEAGRAVDYGQDWYEKIRQAPGAIVHDEQTVPCSCGHSVPRGSVWSTSTGTSCPECYDRMSN